MFTASAMWMYCIVALGALGVYFLLPRTGRSTKSAGAVLALAALGGFAVLGVTHFASAGWTDIYFYMFSAIALVCSVCVITQTRAVYSALYFVVVVLAVVNVALTRRQVVAQLSVQGAVAADAPLPVKRKQTRQPDQAEQDPAFADDPVGQTKLVDHVVIHQ